MPSNAGWTPTIFPINLQSWCWILRESPLDAGQGRLGSGMGMMETCDE